MIFVKFDSQVTRDRAITSFARLKESMSDKTAFMGSV